MKGESLRTVCLTSCIKPTVSAERLRIKTRHLTQGDFFCSSAQHTGYDAVKAGQCYKSVNGRCLVFFGFFYTMQ